MVECVVKPGQATLGDPPLLLPPLSACLSSLPHIDAQLVVMVVVVVVVVLLLLHRVYVCGCVCIGNTAWVVAWCAVVMLSSAAILCTPIR